MIIDKTPKEVVARFINVTKKFGNFVAVSNINLDIYRGEILGFLGPNGAGKSTTMKMMARLLRPTEGQIWIRGNGYLHKMNDRNKDTLLNNIGFLIENPAFYANMTPRQILKYFAEVKGYPTKNTKARVQEVIDWVGMGEWADVKTGKFSKGMRQKIGIISAIVHDPEIIVLDEPHTGLDPTARLEIRDLLLRLKEMGKTIFLSSHLLFEVSEVADRVAMISYGKIVACDTLDNLEALAKKSIIDLEIYTPDGHMDGILDRVTRIVAPYIGLEPGAQEHRFNPDNGIIEIIFNGNPANQVEILKALVVAGIQVLDFSVPKAGLLEDLYVNYMNEDKTDHFAALAAAEVK